MKTQETQASREFQVWLKNNEAVIRGMYRQYRMDIDYDPSEPAGFIEFACELFSYGVLQ